MGSDRLQLRSLYFSKFADSLGVITLVTLLPTYIDLLDPSGALTFAVVLTRRHGRGALSQW